MSEELRLDESRRHVAHWKRWGPYLAERQWGTVREDYSAEGDAWGAFPFEHAQLRAYRWGEDGIGGISDRHQFQCLAFSFWNGEDPILKERLFGLTGREGNHGEDVKEIYAYLDSTPTHSYMKCLYRYPHRAFPYERLRAENAARGHDNREFEILETGLYDDDRYFDVVIEYAKAEPEDILVRVTIHNRGPEEASLHLLPTVWFRNTWSWGGGVRPPSLQRGPAVAGAATVASHHPYLGTRWLVCGGAPELLFTENESNRQALWGGPNLTPYTKDAIHQRVVLGRAGAVNPGERGTKAAAWYRLKLPPRGSREIRLRFAEDESAAAGTGAGGAVWMGAEFDALFADRIAEADRFFEARLGQAQTSDARQVQRQAFAGLMWSKQFYHYDVRQWMAGDPGSPEPPAARREGRNREWKHLYNADVLSMPDKWEYPWYAAWDLAFHCIPLAQVDPDFAKEQLLLLLREWYMHPNGQLPAYEWRFGDVNPPVHAWAAWRVYKIERRVRGQADRAFLERVFHKLLLNFTWWVNRKDPDGLNVFQGGFLGLDNIGVFDRSAPLPTGGHIEQADGTSWMGKYCLDMLAIALELARENPAYEDVASKFFEHFVYISKAMNDLGGQGLALWDEEDGFYYDELHLPSHEIVPLRVRSLVGLVPLFATEILEPEALARLPGFTRRMQWFLDNVPDMAAHVDISRTSDSGRRILLSLVSPDRLRRVLRYALDEAEFLSPYGIRSLSKHHRDHPYIFRANGREYRVDYEPAESRSGLFGGNSNWRGPIWYPLNYLLIESLQRFHHYYGDEWTVEHPVGSGAQRPLAAVAADLSHRLCRIFLRDASGRRPVNGGRELFDQHPHWRDLIFFHEYFHGDTGEGLGASHQTGWTALVAKLLEQSGE